ncbi:MAG: TPM domain-containing protein, partial [Anaerovoracaceae bacterium]|nr:TPM domain-containing protein [Anaerovoracaceae bacterium]
MKRVSSLLIALLIAVFASSPAYAAQKSYLNDDAGLLASSEKTDVESALRQVSQMYDMDTAVLTVYGLEGKSPEEYADDYFDNTYNSDGNIDGIILLVDMESRSWQVETGGRCIDAVNDDGIEYIEDSVVSFLSDGEYGQAFLAYADSVSYLMNLYDSG